MVKKRDDSPESDRGSVKQQRSRSRSRSKSRGRAGPEKKKTEEPKRNWRTDLRADYPVSSDEEEKPKRKYKDEKPVDEAMMMRMMGFASFETTKGKDHSESAAHGVKKTTRRQYRQYMNRRGGFNRPLDS